MTRLFDTIAAAGSSAALLMTVLTGLGLPSDAFALDCAKAAGPIDKAICGNPDLRKADTALSTSYFETLHRLGGSSRNVLIDSQRLWLKERQDQCVQDVGPCVATSIAQRQKTLTACFAAGADRMASHVSASNAPACPYDIHLGCPVLEANGSAGLRAYPFLVEMLVTAVRTSEKDYDCAPESADDPGDPGQNEGTTEATIETERPGLVCIRHVQDGMYRGAAHPFHAESLECYDTVSRAKLDFSSIFPTLTPGSPPLEKIITATKGHVVIGCCNDATTENGTLDDIGVTERQPSGWSIDDVGNLKLAFDYTAYGRSFLATVTVPRATIIDAVAARYQAMFVPAPRTD